MKKMLVIVGSLLLLAAILAACGGQPAPTEVPQAAPTKAPAAAQPTEPPAPPPAPALSGDPIRGGLLYDNWIKVLGVDTPEGNQPLWATQTTNTRSGKDTWRCKECHGWDYLGVDGAYGGGSHKTGFVGVYQVAGKDANEILAALKSENHDFSAYMDDQALIDLALFLANGQFNSASLVGEGKKAAGGDLASGKAVFEENCVDCHGANGDGMNFADESGPEYVGTIANDNPWEFLHKARFGQPGAEKMPALVDVGISDAEYLDLLAYAQSLPTSSPVSEGGRLYDNWIKATGASKMETDFPLWATQTTNTRTGNDTYRCKECHGWDYLGAEGRYASGSHATGFPGIFAAKDKSAEELTAALKGENHDFSQYLDDGQLSAIVAFIQQLQDLKPYINDDKSVNGDPAKGEVIYKANCAQCHGEDGKAIDFDDGEGKEYVGTVAADNPWEVFNKIAYGQPGAGMTAGINMGWSWQDIVDILSYIQTLPTE